MNYLLKSSNFETRQKNTRKKVYVVVAVLVIAVIILVSAPVRNILFFVAGPIWKMENSLADSHLAEYFRTKQTLIDENIALKQELFLLGDASAVNSVLQTENDNLKDLLGRQNIRLKTILASVLLKPPELPYDSLIVDLGQNDNIKVGDKVIANANVYIGTVSEVYPQSSKIILYSSPGQKLQVMLGASSISAEAMGIGGGNFNIQLPKEVGVAPGDVIVIPSITANIFGIVEKVSSADKDSFQTVLFKSPINISELNFVEIVL